MAPPEPLLAWPGLRHLFHASLTILAVGAWFSLVYTGADTLTSLHSWRVPVHLPFELGFPLVPQAALVYLTPYAMMLAAPFLLRTPEAVRATLRALLVMIGVAGLCFVLVPTEAAYPPVPVGEPWGGLMGFTEQVSRRHNLMPSLHVALTGWAAWAFSQNRRLVWKIVFWVWAVAVCASTILTHQHHLLDLVGGAALAAFGVRRYRRCLESP